MHFKYKKFSVELSFSRFEYPTYPCAKGERATMIWEVVINNRPPLSLKGTKKEVVVRVKRAISRASFDFFEDEDDFEDEDYDDEADNDSE